MATLRGDSSSFLARPLSLTDATTIWTREILVSGGFVGSQLNDIYTHSCRATLLSWAAKFGVSGGARRFLGYHAKPGDHSMLEYSKDSLAGPMREVAKIVDCIRLKTFIPDATRSGYFPKDAVLEMPSLPLSDMSPRSRPPTRACLDDFKSLTDDHVYIGRGSKRKFGGLPRSPWHNPVSIRHGEATRDEAVASYSVYLYDKTNKELLNKVSELGGKLLVCHCKLSQSCHGDILVQAWHAQSDAGAFSGEGPDPEEETSSPSSSDSESEKSDQDLAVGAEFCREAIVNDIAAGAMSAGCPLELPAGGLWMHSKWGTWHKGCADLENIGCGRKLSESSLDRYLRMGAWPGRTVAWCQIRLKRAEPGFPRDGVLSIEDHPAAGEKAE